MIIEIEQIPMRGKAKPFEVAAFSFEYQTSSFDKELLDSLIALAAKQAKVVWSGTANNGGVARGAGIKLADSFVGILAEYAWKYFINLMAIDLTIGETEMVSSKNQIDLKVLRNDKTAEVRSSIVRNGIDFALTSPSTEFHLIGPYETEYKPHEGQKSYYLGALCEYAGNKEYLIEYVMRSRRSKPFSLHIVAGATREMMLDNSQSDEREEKADTSRASPLGFSAGDVTAGTTRYRAMEFTNAYDVRAMVELILSDTKTLATGFTPNAERGCERELSVQTVPESTSMPVDVDLEDSCICESPECQKPVNNKVRSYSQKHFNGKIYCYGCQQKHQLSG